VSLILEALKKLEREKHTPDRGFVVLTPMTWPAAGIPRPLAIGLPVMLVTAAAGLGAYLALARAPERVAVPPPAVVVAPRPAAVEAPPAAAPVPAARLRTAARAAAPAPAAEDAIELQAISERDGKPVAVLNGRVVGEGDGFDQVRVIRIGAAEVEVEIRGKRRVLQF
jgi:hypothetical protein